MYTVCECVRACVCVCVCVCTNSRNLHIASAVLCFGSKTKGTKHPAAALWIDS